LPGSIERVRSDRGLGRYSRKMVYILSGGAATGFCHLEMIEALEERGIRPDLVIGTSAGALFGALYCHFGNIEDVFRKLSEALSLPLIVQKHPCAFHLLTESAYSPSTRLSSTAEEGRTNPVPLKISGALMSAFP